jgi:hypothetical protein
MTAFGTFRTSRDVRLESGMRTKADVGFPPNLWVHARVLGRPGERRDHYTTASRF